MSWTDRLARVFLDNPQPSSAGKRPASLQGRRVALETLENRHLLSVGGEIAAAAGEYDFGDAPDSYGTVLASSGAQHEAVGPTLGATRDAEADGLASAGADGDDTDTSDDEDGVTLPATFAAGELSSVTVNVQNAPSGAKLDAWIDFDGDGTFENEELFINGVTVAEGNTVFMFHMPETAVAGDTYARFRLSNEGDLGPTGSTDSGEVEDYLVTIEGLDLGEVDFYGESGIDLSAGDGIYYFSTSQAGLLTVDATSDSAAGDVTLRLLDGEGTTIDEVTGSDGYLRIDHTETLAGNDYQLEISGSNTGVDLRICNLVSQTGQNVVVSDTSGDDSFLFGVSETYDVRANGVEYSFNDANNFTFNATDGNDTMEFVDSDGDDTLTIGPTQATLAGTPDGGTAYSATANGFANVYGYAKSGGDDSAVMVGSDLSERVKVSPDLVKVMSSDYYQRAKFFETVSVDMLAGNNAAVMAGSDEADVLMAMKGDMRIKYDAAIPTGTEPSFASMTYDVTVAGCTDIVARSGGGNDWVELHDSSTTDVLIAKPHKVEIMNAPRVADNVERGEEYIITARGFRHVTGIADQGGDDDAAKLYDTGEDGTDTWTASRVAGETLSTMSSPTQLLYEVLAFEQVGGYGYNGGLGDDHGTNVKQHTAQADFVFQYGVWE